ncbi:MAG TPA: hypothetical protein VMY42_20655 [Thermoguttaceae bacterium]|nr:hypothetical protein [Thermoguttaceae bacterium]
MEPLFIGLTCLLAMWLAGRLFAVLTANALIVREVDQETRTFAVEAANHVYRGSIVGRHFATGYARAFEVCDEAIGIAYAEADNTSGADAAITVRVFMQGDFVLALTGVTCQDVGKAVYATDSGAIALTGHALAFLGRIVGVEAANLAIVRLKDPGELPGEADDGTVLCRGGPWAKATGNNGAGTEYLDGDGGIVASTLGLGVIPAADNRLQLSLDTTDEASHATVMTYPKFDLDKGVVFEAVVAAYSTTGVAMTGANVDFEFGIADAIAPTDVDPTRHVRFHVDGAGTTLLLGADDDSADVAEADTSLELPMTVATAVRYTIIVRLDGSVEVYADGVAIAAPSLAAIDMSSGGNVAGYVNVEKTAAAGIAIVEILRFFVAGGR